MSHFTHIKTCFQNLSYLEKALNKLNILYTTNKVKNLNKKTSNSVNLVISQVNGHNIEFAWNGQEYELIADLSFWNQPYPIESFNGKVAQQYASEVIIGETQKIGFQPVRNHQNIDGSTTLVLERWNSN